MAKWMEETKGNIVLFHPFIPNTANSEVAKVLQSRWIGQGPKVEEFEKLFAMRFNIENCISLNSGTAALHLAYILAGVGEGDEVVCPVFTCTATNIPLLYLGAKPVFVDVNPKTLNIDIDSLKHKITKKTKAIVTVDFGGLPCDYDPILEIAAEFGIPVIQDAAHSLGGKYKGKYVGAIADYTIFSFQAIKHITTGDGGMLAIKDNTKVDLARRLRWFGIDRENKIKGVWENDIRETGFKYHMNDIAATLGIEGVKSIDFILNHRQHLSQLYFENLRGVAGLESVGERDLLNVEHAAWVHTIMVDNRRRLMDKLLHEGIESAQVHYRNDSYSIFSGSSGSFPKMDSVQDKYLVLPLHMKVKEEDVHRICKVIKSGW